MGLSFSPGHILPVGEAESSQRQETQRTQGLGSGLACSHTHIPLDKANNVVKLSTHGVGPPRYPIKVEGRE